MKFVFLRLFFVSLFCGGVVSEPPPSQRFALGGHWYELRLVKQASEKENTHTTYFVVSRAGRQERLCSAVYRSVRRVGGQLLATGAYQLTPQRVQFTTRYTDAKTQVRIPGTEKVFVSPDSSRTVFLPDGHGRLRLTQAQEFRSGEVTTYNY